MTFHNFYFKSCSKIVTVNWAAIFCSHRYWHGIAVDSWKQENTLNWSSYLDSYCKISRAGNKYFNVIAFRVTSWFWKSRSYRGITSESQYSFAHTDEKFLLYKAKERKNTAIKTVFNQALRTLTSCLSFSTVIYLFWR
jgi:hypothetical protein